MARRITKSAKPPNTIRTFPELPGAVFAGRGCPNDDDLECARYLQGVRDEYEQDGHAPTLIRELTQFGFPDSEIAAALLNPATITSCGYCRDLAGYGALIAA